VVKACYRFADFTESPVRSLVRTAYDHVCCRIFSLVLDKSFLLAIMFVG